MTPMQIVELCTLARSKGCDPDDAQIQWHTDIAAGYYNRTTGLMKDRNMSLVNLYLVTYMQYWLRKEKKITIYCVPQGSAWMAAIDQSTGFTQKEESSYTDSLYLAINYAFKAML